MNISPQVNTNAPSLKHTLISAKFWNFLIGDGSIIDDKAVPNIPFFLPVSLFYSVVFSSNSAVCSPPWGLNMKIISIWIVGAGVTTTPWVGGPDYLSLGLAQPLLPTEAETGWYRDNRRGPSEHQSCKQISPKNKQCHALRHVCMEQREGEGRKVFRKLYWFSNRVFSDMTCLKVQNFNSFEIRSVSSIPSNRFLILEL